MEMVKHSNGSFSGDSKTLTVKNGADDTVLVATNTGDDFWSCTESDLPGTPVNGLISTDQSSFHLTAEERKRASEAYDLCAVLRHSGDAAVISALDKRLPRCHSSHRSRLPQRATPSWPCLACEVAKMKPPMEPISHHEPARQVGEHRRAAILKFIGAEIDNLKAPGVLKPIRYKDVPKEHLGDIIGIYMFHREKFKADDTFEKDKTRIVLLSNRRDPSKIGETHCPTVNPISVMTQLNLAAAEKRLISAYDIKGAFLLTPLRDGIRMFIKISGEVVKYWLER